MTAYTSFMNEGVRKACVFDFAWTDTFLAHKSCTTEMGFLACSREEFVNKNFRAIEV